MRVLFCGTSGGGDNFELDRANASVLVEHAGTSVLLDCGGGSLRQLVAGGKRLTDIRAVAISHLHHDHVLGLAELFGRLVALNAGDLPPVYGPVGTADFVARVVEMVKPLVRRDAVDLSEYRARDVAPGADIRVGEIVLEPFEVRHAQELQCYGWRVSAGGKVVVYSGDTAAVPEIMIPIAQDADLLIHDAFSTEALASLRLNAAERIRARFGGSVSPEELQARLIERDERLVRFPEIHGAAREVGLLASAARSRMLALTSIGRTEKVASLEAEVRSGYVGALVTASDGLSIDLGGI